MQANDIIGIERKNLLTKLARLPELASLKILDRPRMQANRLSVGD